VTGQPGTPHLQQVLPTARAILWRPVPAGAARAPGTAYPIFIEQKAVGALHDHALAAKGQALLGFLVGDLYVCPTTKIRYAVIDSTIRLNQAIYGDKTLVVVSRLWERIQEELRRIHGALIGWYHSHPTTPAALSAGDVETHEQYFTQPWQTALVMGRHDGADVAGLFRPGSGPAWASESLQFYELIEGDPRLTAGRKRSVQPWSNFTTDDPAAVREVSVAAPRESGGGPGDRSTIEVVGAHEEEARPPRVSAPIPKPPPPPPPPPRKSAPPAPPKAPASPPPPVPAAAKGLPLLDTTASRPSEPVFTKAAPEPPPAPPPAPPPRPSASAPARRPSRRSTPAVGKMFVTEEPRRRRGGLVALLVFAVLGGTAWYLFLGPGVGLWQKPQGSGAALAIPAQDSTAFKLDRLGDSLARTVSRYRERAKLFDNRQIDCAALAPGLVSVEDVMMAYSRGRARTPMLDSTRLAHDQLIAAGADSVERHFDRSGCARP
jgi:proteasome lid subunit RPN8/RPN11